MKFLIFYECRNEDGFFSGQFEFEAKQEPTKTDKAAIEAALEDSVKFHKSGMAGLSITSISSVS
ncbi:MULTISPECIES: hypothetical protein [Nitrosomonas]|uniref:hypothetical protein n=1 Tax=Nitrosomonas TaxID=914 RepID=UPI000303A56E|nr:MULTISPECIES: hypothetical protein [Nitrosomonas]MDL1865600.1 hypothetical protein [Betaproteobacteria bacterium PRO5]SDW85550.1 hypothetical protein SAMN05216310_14522 [Nitrosomonas europaea]SET39188.1 hypothetical protein SAMN05216309_14422 [Nitrosomonas europaea]SJZ93987.1 hypothetical protein SAMN02745113_02275 [Nitrosomonas europaea]HBF24167.1 hypothetical protein [Nitrosomonas sp.]